MAYDLPTVPGDKKEFFYKRLLREVSNFFVWKGLEELGIPVDYVERELITRGRMMFFEDDQFGHLILPCSATGRNLYNEPVMARSVATTTEEAIKWGEKKIVYIHNQKMMTDKTNTCLLLDNMYGAESLHEVLDFYATRMGMVWQSFDTNLLWQNLPVIISVQSEPVRLSIEKLLQDVWKGKPAVVKDDMLKISEESVRYGIAEVPIILKELFDAYQELYNDFKAQIGIQATAVDKQSGVSDQESSSNQQHVKTALQVMLSQRQHFCNLANTYYGLNLSVSINEAEEEGGQDGESDNRTSELSEDSNV